VGNLGQIIGERIGDEEAQDGHDAAVKNRSAENIDVDRAVEEGQVVVETVEILGPAHFGHRQIGPEGIFEQIEIGEDNERQQPESRQHHEENGERNTVPAQQLIHAASPAAGGVSSARMTACEGSNTMCSLLPGGGTTAAPSLRVSTVSMRPSPLRTWMLMKLPS